MIDSTGPAPAPPPEPHSARAWPRIAPFAAFIALMAVEPYLAELVEPLFDPRWLYAIRSAVTALILIGLWRYYAELRRDREQTPAPAATAWTLGIGAGVVVFVLWIVLDVPPLVMGEAEDPFDPRVNGQIHWGFALTRLAGSALVVPIMEELFWRSFLMRWLKKPRFLDVDPRSVGWKPLLITSAIFAVEHRLWFAGLLAGLIYGEMYRRTGSIRIVIVAHAITNGVLGVYVLWTGSWGFW